MAITITRAPTGLVGVIPATVYLHTNASYSTITTLNWLAPYIKEGNVIQPTDILFVSYASNAFGFFIPSITSSGITLNPYVSAGNVLLPVVDGDFATFNGATGQIKDAGYSPSDATKTKVPMLNAATVVVGRVVTFSATTGTIQDSGTLLSALQLSANIKAARTANIGGAGAGPISVAVAGLTAASIVTASIQASSNAAAVQKVTATSSGFDILFSADPGATCTVNYVAFVVAQ